VVVLVILGVAWLTFTRVGPLALVLLVLLLAGQLVWFARAESRRATNNPFSKIQ
jgi:hypothetical protein